MRVRGKKSRDSQKQRVYTAEWKVNGKYGKVADVAEAQGYVNKILRSAWWKKRGIVSIVDVCWRKSYRHAATALVYYDNSRRMEIGEIRVRMNSGFNKMVLLHELTHILIWDWIRLAGCADHGPEFVKFYLLMVRTFLGKEAANELRKKFVEGGVSYRSGKIKITPSKTVPKEMKNSGKDKPKIKNNKAKRVSSKLRDATNTLSVVYPISQRKLLKAIEDGRWTTIFLYDYMKRLGYEYRQFGFYKEWSKEHKALSKYEERFAELVALLNKL